MLVIKFKRAIGADWFQSTRSQSARKLIAGRRYHRCCFGGASKYGQANGDFSREQTVLRSLLAWSEVVEVSSTKVLYLRCGRLQFQGVSDASSAARKTSEYLSTIYNAVYEKDHSNKYSMPTGRRKYFLLRHRTVSFNVTICRDNLHAQSALPRTMSEPMIPNSNMAALLKNLALIFATLPLLRPML